MNYIFLLFATILIFGLMILFYKLFKKNGLFLYIVLISSILSIISFKAIDILSFQVSLGVLLIMGIFICNNIIIQRYGLDEVKKIIYSFLGSFIIPIFIISLVGLMTSSDYFLSSSNSFDGLFAYNLNNIRIIVALIFSISFMLWYNGVVYYYIRRIKNKLLFSNIGSILIIQFIESILFIFIAYIGMYGVVEMFGMIVIRYLLKLLIGMIGFFPILVIIKMRDK